MVNRDQPYGGNMQNLLKALSYMEHAAYAVGLASFIGFGVSPERGIYLIVLGLAAARWQDTLGKK